MVQRTLLILSFFIIIIVSCSDLSWADSNRSEPLVLNDTNILEAENLLNDGDFPFAVLQITKPDLIDKKIAVHINKFINDGGVLWFYDSRLAKHFGMKNSPMKIKGLETKGMEAEYGSGKMVGAAVGAAAVKDSPIKGFRRVAVFVIMISEDTYSAVADSEGVIPVLRVPKSKSLVGAIKMIGKGKVIFKPLLWEKQYDGNAFQRNIIRYSLKK